MTRSPITDRTMSGSTLSIYLTACMFAVVLGAIMVLGATVARADSIADTFGHPGSGYQMGAAFNGASLQSRSQSIANTFTVGAFDVITAITAEVYGASPVTFAVFADQGGAPTGAAIWASQTQQMPDPGLDTAITFSGLNITVLENSAYWLLLLVPWGYGPADLWDYSTATDATTIAIPFGAGWDLVSGEPLSAFEVEGERVIEPSSAVLLGSVLIGVCATRRRCLRQWRGSGP